MSELLGALPEREYLVAQQMINGKDNNQGLVNTGFLNCDKQQAVAVKKTALRDLHNNNGTVLPKSSASSGSITDAIKLSGSKRPASEVFPSSPCHQSPNNANGNFVYNRRKSELELLKGSTCEIIDDGNSPQRRPFNYVKQEVPRQQNQMQGPNMSYPSAFTPIPRNISSGGPSLTLSLGKPVSSLSSTDLNQPAATPGIVSINSQKTTEQHFKDRFMKLQALLKSYDNSSHEEYHQMLKSLSSSGRSQHAVELEKRAIHLMLEESKELHRMKSLNVLSKSVPKNIASPSATQTPQ